MSDEKAIDAKEKVGVNPEMIIQNYIENKKRRLDLWSIQQQNDPSETNSQ